jgi:hypothetical protein
MAFTFTEHESGTKSTTATTEHVLQTTSPNTTAGEFQFFLDLNALTAGTTLKIRVKEKVISGGTIRTILRDFVTGVLATDDFGWASPKLLLINGWDFSIECSASTISIPWSIRKLADAGVTLASGAITTASFAAGAINAAAIATGAIDADALATDAVTEIWAGSTDITAINAIKTQTDKLVFTVTNQVDANIQSVNDVTVNGTGAVGNTWGP